MTAPVVSAPADKRFRRAQVKPSTRPRHTGPSRWWRVAALGLVVAGVVAIAVWSVTAARTLSWLQVQDIRVAGTHRMSEGDVLGVLEELKGRHVFEVDLAEWQDRLHALPWVREATLRRELPSTIAVRITERVPMATARLGTTLYLVDVDGMIIDEYGPAYAAFNLPIVEGLAGPGTQGLAIDQGRLGLAARVLGSFGTNPALARQVSQVDVSDVDNVMVWLNGDPTALYLGREQFAARVQQYLDLGPTVRERLSSGLEYVDLRFPDRMYVKSVRRASAGTRP